MIVVDSSAVLEVLLRTPACAKAERRILAPKEVLCAPHLLDLEVAQVLRRYWLSGVLTVERAREALADFLDLRISRYPHDVFVDRIWELKSNMTAYDAAFVALAEALRAPLITRDKRLARSTGHSARIVLV